MLPVPELQNEQITEAAKVINSSKKPLIVWGQGVILAEAENEFKDFVENWNTCCLDNLGSINLPTEHPLNMEWWNAR